MATPLFSKRMSIVIDGSTLLMPTDFSFSASKDMIEIAYLGSSSAKRAIPDAYGATISFSGIVAQTSTVEGGKYALENLMAKFKTDASVSIYLLPDVTANKYYTMPGYLNSIGFDGGVGSAVTYSGEVTADGDWTENTTA